MSSTPIRGGNPAALGARPKVILKGGQQIGKNGKGVKQQSQLRNTRGVQEPLNDVRGGNGKTKCRYLKGGTCTTHGPGAISKWKPKRVTINEEDGTVTTKIIHHYYYVCDLAPKVNGGRGGKLMQTRIPFLMMNKMNTDNNAGVGGEPDDNFSLSTHSTSEEGQSVGYEVTRNERLVDEN